MNAVLGGRADFNFRRETEFSPEEIIYIFPVYLDHCSCSVYVENWLQGTSSYDERRNPLRCTKAFSLLDLFPPGNFTKPDWSNLHWKQGLVST